TPRSAEPAAARTALLGDARLQVGGQDPVRGGLLARAGGEGTTEIADSPLLLGPEVAGVGQPEDVPLGGLHRDDLDGALVVRALRGLDLVQVVAGRGQLLGDAHACSISRY